MRKAVLLAALVGLLASGTAAHAQGETEVHYGKACKTFSAGSNSARVCAMVNSSDVEGWDQGLGRIEAKSGTCNSVTWYATRLYNQETGGILRATETDDTDPCAVGQFQSSPFYEGVDVYCYGWTRAYVVFPGGWVLDTVRGATVLCH